jgi:hypothetical protein
MLSQTLKEVQAEKTQKFQKAAGSLTRAKEALDGCEKDRASAETAVAASNVEATTTAAAFEESANALKNCEMVLEKMRHKLQSGDALIGAAAMESEQLRSVRAETSNASETLALARLQEACAGWALSPTKLENITLLEGEICQRLGTLNETISKAAVARVSLAAGVANAETSLRTAKEHHQACSAALAQAKKKQQVFANVLKSKAQLLKEQQTTVGLTVRAWQRAQRSLTDFHKGPGNAFKDLSSEIEQQHGINLIDDITASSPAAELEAKKNLQMELFPQGTPVIDRRQHQAILRRRSAALPTSCYRRLSSMARRSSMLARRVEADKVAAVHLQKDEEMTQDGAVLDAARRAPTPNRTPISDSH